jgi:hypothetical protein
MQSFPRLLAASIAALTLMPIYTCPSCSDCGFVEYVVLGCFDQVTVSLPFEPCLRTGCATCLVFFVRSDSSSSPSSPSSQTNTHQLNMFFHHLVHSPSLPRPRRFHPDSSRHGSHFLRQPARPLALQRQKPSSHPKAHPSLSADLSFLSRRGHQGHQSPSDRAANLLLLLISGLWRSDGIDQQQPSGTSSSASKPCKGKWGGR